MSDYRLGFFKEPYKAARLAGMGLGGATTCLIASPCIALDWFYRLLKRCMCHPDLTEEELAYEICTYDIPELFVNDRIFSLNEEGEPEEMPSYKTLYKGGAFAKYSLGIPAEAVGTAVNIIVSGAVFFTASILKAALYTTGACIVAPFIACTALIVGACLIGRGLFVGFQQTFRDAFQGLFERASGLIG